MSGFTRDPLYYGEQLVYEALESKWSRYHHRCGCGRDWVAAHAVPAGLNVVRKGNGFVALTGPGLTEGVDESGLTTDVLWRAVTGTDGRQDWPEPVHVVERPAVSAAPDEQRRATHAAQLDKQRRRSAEARVEPMTGPQRNYLRSLVTGVDQVRFDDLFAQAIKGTPVSPRAAGEETLEVVERLTKAAARRLISALKEERKSDE